MCWGKKPTLKEGFWCVRLSRNLPEKSSSPCQLTSVPPTERQAWHRKSPSHFFGQNLISSSHSCCDRDWRNNLLEVLWKERVGLTGLKDLSVIREGNVTALHEMTEELSCVPQYPIMSQLLLNSTGSYKWKSVCFILSKDGSPALKHPPCSWRHSTSRELLRFFFSC